MALLEFAEWLKQEMERQGISQADLARGSGISSSQISKILSAKSAPSAEALASLARGLRILPELVFQKANIFSANLPPDARVSPEATELATIALALDAGDRALLVEIARVLYRRTKK